MNRSGQNIINIAIFISNLVLFHILETFLNSESIRMEVENKRNSERIPSSSKILGKDKM